MTPGPATWPPEPDPRPLARRLWVYQAERFPMAQHGPLIVILALSAYGVSSAAAGDPSWPPLGTGIAACLVLIGLFLKLRLADEVKDAEDDRRWRPYRPVPRGLVTLDELARVGFVTTIVELVATAALSIALLVPWLMVLFWFRLMTAEFHAPEWLRARPVLYLTSHMAILPLISLYATACHWLVEGADPGWTPILLFLGLSYVNGIVLEVGRKIRSPLDEEEGVETYSVLWGRELSVSVWLTAIAAAAALVASLGAELGVGRITWPAAGLGLIGAGATALAFRHRVATRSATSRPGKLIEAASALWILVSQLAVGIAPVLLAAGGTSGGDVLP